MHGIQEAYSCVCVWNQSSWKNKNMCYFPGPSAVFKADNIPMAGVKSRKKWSISDVNVAEGHEERRL